MTEIFRIENHSFKSKTLKEMLSPLKNDRALRSIEISNCDLGEKEINVLVDFISNNHRVKKLSLINTNLHNKPLAAFRSILTGAHGIENIILAGNQLEVRELITMGVLQNPNSSLKTCDVVSVLELNKEFNIIDGMITLDFSNKMIGDEIFTLLFFKLNSYSGPEKVVLDLKNNQLTSKIIPLFKILLRKNLLKALNLSRSNHFTENDWEILGNEFANSTLEELDVGYNNLQDNGITTLFKNIRNHPTLCTINMIDNKITDIGAQEIARLIRENPNLKYVNLCYNLIHALGCFYISVALKINTSMLTLNLNSNHIEDTGAGYLAAVLNNHSSLITLELYSNKITNRGAALIAQALKSNKDLIELNLGANQITHSAALVIHQMLSVNQTLQVCNLSENQIGGTALDLLKANRRVCCSYNEFDPSPGVSVVVAAPLPNNQNHVYSATVIPLSAIHASSASATSAPRFWKYSLRQVSPAQTLHPHQKDIYPINTDSVPRQHTAN